MNLEQLAQKLPMHEVEINGEKEIVVSIKDLKKLGSAVTHPKIFPKIISTAMFGFNEDKLLALLAEGMELRANEAALEHKS